MSDQSGPWIDVFAIIPTDLGKSLHFFRQYRSDDLCCCLHVASQSLTHQQCVNLFRLISIARYVQSSQLKDGTY